MSAFVGTINYTNAFVAQYEGAGRKDRVMASVWQAIFLAILAGVVFLGWFPLRPPSLTRSVTLRTCAAGDAILPDPLLRRRPDAADDGARRAFIPVAARRAS